MEIKRLEEPVSVDSMEFEVVYCMNNGNAVPVFRTSTLSKLMHKSSTFFNTAFKRAINRGITFEAGLDKDYIDLDKYEDIVHGFGNKFVGLSTLRVFTLAGFNKTMAFGSANEVNIEEVAANPREAYALAQKEAERDISEKKRNKKQTSLPAEEELPDLPEDGYTDNEGIVWKAAGHSVKEKEQSEKPATNLTGITLNGKPLSFDEEEEAEIDPYDTYEETYGSYGNGAEKMLPPVGVERSKGHAKKADFRARDKALSEPSKNSRPKFSRVSEPKRGIDSGFASFEEEIPAEVPVAAPAKTLNTEAGKAVSFGRMPELLDIAVPEIVTESALHDKSVAERLHILAESINKEESPEFYNAVILMTAAIAAEGDSNGKISLKPAKKMKKALFSTASVAEAFGVTEDTINNIAEKLGMRKKPYGKMVCLIEAGDIILTRFYYNKKAIRKFSEIFALADAEA